MKIQRQLSKKRGSKVYHKYVVVIPNEVIEKADLEEGDELDAEARKGEVRLKKQ